MSTSKICIVDDEPSAREVLGDVLEPEGYELLFFPSADELLGYLKADTPDVILLDVMMPNNDGFAVSKQLKSDHRYQHIPIILITALSGRSALLQGLEAGADEFLSKPVNSLELRARVRTMLRIKMQYDALQNAMLLREELAHMVVHDMKHPIVAAMSHCYLMQITPATEQMMSEGIEAILAQLRRLQGFADDILTIARMEDGKFALELSPVDLRQLIQAVIDEHQVLARITNINLSADLPKEPVHHLVDIEILKRVLENLLSNALKYSGEGSSVTVRMCYATTCAHTLRIQVIDTGPGIDPLHRDKIFDKFEIATLKQSGVPQTGIGLAFSQKAVEAHGGILYVSENQPNGSVFTIELPSACNDQ